MIVFLYSFLWKKREVKEQNRARLHESEASRNARYLQSYERVIKENFVSFFFKYALIRIGLLDKNFPHILFKEDFYELEVICFKTF